MIDIDKQTIRKAINTDIKNIIPLVHEFYQYSISEYGVTLDHLSLADMIGKCITEGIVFVLEDNNEIVGVIGGLIFPFSFNKNLLVAQEFTWYVKRDYRKQGIKLFNCFEQECKLRGANFIIMASMGNSMFDKVDTFYNQNNYKIMEVQYIKEV